MHKIFFLSFRVFACFPVFALIVSARSSEQFFLLLSIQICSNGFALRGRDKYLSYSLGIRVSYQSIHLEKQHTQIQTFPNFIFDN